MCNPLSSYYNEPTVKHCFEINQERNADACEGCERYGCKDEAVMQVQVRDEKSPYLSGWWVVVCKNHYESVLDDEIEAAEEYEPDWEDD